MFVGASTRVNLPYSFTRDRFKLAADYRGPGSLRLSAGADQDNVQRTLQETDSTRETTVWARASARATDTLSLSLKLAHADRDNNGYNVVAAIQPPENPLLRKYNLADRSRDRAGLRADMTFGEGVSVGLAADWANDDYKHSSLGLTGARTSSLGLDVSAALNDETQLRAYAQTERIRSAQAGSQQAAAPDWTGTSKDKYDVIGFGLTHSALKGKLELGADLSYSRSHSNIEVDNGGAIPALPTATSSLDSIKLFANYRLKDKLSLLTSVAYESLDTRDWRLDGVLPASVPNLLAFGEQPPHYRVGVLRVALRQRF
jgi:MtrB/PioB family decaheme-associated outer membrane protein